MANTNNVREIRTRLSLDGETAFRKSLKSVDSSLTAMKAELKNVSTGFDRSTDSMEKNRKKSEILQRMQEQLKIKVDSLSDAVKTSSKAYEDAKKKAEDLTAEYGENSDKAKLAWAEVETLGNKMDRMATMSYNAQSKLNTVAQELRGVESASKDAGSKLGDTDKAADEAAKGGFTVLKGAASDLVSDGLSKVYDSLRDIVTEFGNADSVYNNFAIKTGSSAADMEKYSESIMGLYKEGYGDSLSSISDGMAVVKQSMRDVPTDKLEEVTEYALTLEEAFGYDVAESMRAANSLVDQFGVSYSDAYDLIIQGAQKGLDQNGDLLDVINEYSVQFKDSGHSAEDMFNMLANAAATGVWSVDKLGDAWKEFNINTSDGTADEALQALGLGFSESAADAEVMERAAFNVSKAEIALAEAQADAATALEENGENSIEYKKTLNDVTEAEYALTDAKSAYNEAANATSYNLDEIKGKLSSGGAAAQEAQQQIITALMGVEDESERYVLGQKLMGTTWEDLGEDAINALFNTQGEISTTKDAMQDVIDLQYEDIGSQLEKVGRKAKTEIAEPLIKKYMPKVEKGIEWVSENLEDIIPTVETIGKVVVTAFAAKKVYDFGSSAGKAVKGFINIVKGLTTATSAQTAAQTALNATNPWGWVTLAVAGVGALTLAIVDNYESYDDMVEKAAALTEEEQKLRDETNKVIEKFQDWKTAKEETATKTDAEFKYYDDLKTNLDNIVDANGKIKEGYEDRAKFITGKLGEVTGIEIEIVDGTIQKYNELSDAIDKALQKKKAEAYLGAAQSEYNDVVVDEQEAYKKMKSNQETFDRQVAKLDEKTQLAEKYKKEMEQALLIEDEYESAAAYAEAKNDYESTLAEVEGLYKKIYIGTDEEEAQIEKVKKAEETYAGYVATIQNYESLDYAVSSGDTTAMNIALAKYKYNFRDATQASKEELEKQRDNYKKLMEQMKEDLKAGMPGVTQESVRQVEMLVNATNTEIAHAGTKYKKSSKSSMQQMVSGMKSTEPEVRSAANSLISAASGEMYEGGGGCYNAGRYAGENLASGIAAATSAASSAVNSLFDAAIAQATFVSSQKIPHFAKGTNNFRGGFAVINENDKGELVNLPDGSQVIPHDISLRYAEEAAARASIVNNSFGNINVQINNPSLSSGQDVQSTAVQLSETVISEIARRIDGQKRRSSAAVGR